MILGITILWLMLWGFTVAVVRAEERQIFDRELNNSDYRLLFIAWWLYWIYRLADEIEHQWAKL